jgi:hypothetical protein
MAVNFIDSSESPPTRTTTFDYPCPSTLEQPGCTQVTFWVGCQPGVASSFVEAIGSCMVFFRP